MLHFTKFSFSGLSGPKPEFLMKPTNVLEMIMKKMKELDTFVCFVFLVEEESRLFLLVGSVLCVFSLNIVFFVCVVVALFGKKYKNRRKKRKSFNPFNSTKI